MNRRLSRELSLKILYRYEEGDRDIPKIFQSIFEGKKYPKGVREFSQRLVGETMRYLPEIDHEIIKVLKNWSYDRLSVIDKAIIRMGVCEILYFNDIPAEVSINEAIEVGKKYGDEDSGRFINGILDAVKKRDDEGCNNK